MQKIITHRPVHTHSKKTISPYKSEFCHYFNYTKKREKGRGGQIGGEVKRTVN